jgi:hypothetical protein
LPADYAEQFPATSLPQPCTKAEDVALNNKKKLLPQYYNSPKITFQQRLSPSLCAKAEDVATENKKKLLPQYYHSSKITSQQRLSLSLVRRPRTLRLKTKRGRYINTPIVHFLRSDSTIKEISFPSRRNVLRPALFARRERRCSEEATTPILSLQKSLPSNVSHASLVCQPRTLRLITKRGRYINTPIVHFLRSDSTIKEISFPSRRNVLHPALFARRERRCSEEATTQLLPLFKNHFPATSLTQAYVRRPRTLRRITKSSHYIYTISLPSNVSAPAYVRRPRTLRRITKSSHYIYTTTLHF